MGKSEVEKFSLEVDGEQLNIELSRHASDRRADRDVSLFEIEEAFMLAGERVLNIRDKSDFAIRKTDEYIIIANLWADDDFIINVDIITVLGQEETQLYRNVYTLDV